MSKRVVCQLCGNELVMYDFGCQSGGPMPDGCPFNRVGFKDAMKSKPKNQDQDLRDVANKLRHRMKIRGSAS